MDVKILDVGANQLVDAEIRKGIKSELPSMQEGWVFNFNKHSKAKNAQTFVLVKKKTPNTIEGCLIFEMKDGSTPYMKFIECAPRNRGAEKEHDYVAGCLIAYATHLSRVQAKNDNEIGFLTFDVMEQNKQNEIKLMALYCQNYGAIRFGQTTMIIIPSSGNLLSIQYLER